MLMQLKLAGKFNGVTGIIFQGEMLEIAVNETLRIGRFTISSSVFWEGLESQSRSG